MANRRGSLGVRKRFIQLLFFALTFLLFVGLQNSLQYFGPAWKYIKIQLKSISPLVLFLSGLGLFFIAWILYLGLNEFITRVCDSSENSYESSSSEDDDAETGRRYQKKYSKEPPQKNKKKLKNNSNQKSAATDDDQKDPTDVDVTVHPVDTTIAAGGEAKVSPYYNVSLMNFTENPPLQQNIPNIYPTAPMMQGGPAYFKRNF